MGWLNLAALVVVAIVSALYSESTFKLVRWTIGESENDLATLKRAAIVAGAPFREVKDKTAAELREIIRQLTEDAAELAAELAAIAEGSENDLATLKRAAIAAGASFCKVKGKSTDELREIIRHLTEKAAKHSSAKHSSAKHSSAKHSSAEYLAAAVRKIAHDTALNTLPDSPSCETCGGATVTVDVDEEEVAEMAAEMEAAASHSYWTAHRKIVEK